MKNFLYVVKGTKVSLTKVADALAERKVWIVTKYDEAARQDGYDGITLGLIEVCPRSVTMEVFGEVRVNLLSELVAEVVKGIEGVKIPMWS